MIHDVTKNGFWLNVFANVFMIKNAEKIKNV